MRMIQMMGQLILAAMHVKNEGSLVLAAAKLDEVMHIIMPEQAELIEMVDEDTVFKLLGDKRLVDAYVGLQMDQAELQHALGNALKANQMEIRAAKLFIINLRNTLRMSPEGHMIWGRLSGLDLEGLLERNDFLYLKEIEELIQKGIIPAA